VTGILSSRGFALFELGYSHPLPQIFSSFSCAKLRIYTVLIAGWSSNSGYSLLDGLHALAQTISYEVRLALTVFEVCVCKITDVITELLTLVQLQMSGGNAKAPTTFT
jgi:NADH:ubiquinone oxidoreductase subunit H